MQAGDANHLAEPVAVEQKHPECEVKLTSPMDLPSVQGNYDYGADVQIPSDVNGPFDEAEPAPAAAEANGIEAESDADAVAVVEAPAEGPDGPAMLWTMDEETVFMHSSQNSLERIRTRLEALLLGVSHAIQVRKVRGESVEGQQEERSPSPGRSPSRRRLDFAELLHAADHSLRRIVGEAFTAFVEAEVVQMVQLCSLADKGAQDCDELVRNAVVVLQALTQDGAAVRNVEQFRHFVSIHRDEIATPQWRHDYVTAIRSLAVGFLRQPVPIMAAYGSSINQLVEHEALYIGLLRLCGGRPIGNTPAPHELPANTEVAALHPAPSPQKQQRHSAAAGMAATANRTASGRNHVNSKHVTSVIHTPKNKSKLTHVRRLSTTQGQPMPSASEHLEALAGYLGSGASPSGPNSPIKKTTSSRRSSTMAGPTPAQLHDLQQPIRSRGSSVSRKRRTSVTRTPQAVPAAAAAHTDPMPEVPQRLSVHSRRNQSMAHY